MKIKKRLKHKSCLPKADYSMDPKALSNMNKQAAEETPAQGGGLSMANAALGGINTGLGAVSAFTPKDNNDGIGISHKTSNITSGITGGLDAASGIASSVPGVGQAVGAGLGIVSKFITMIKGAVDHKRENDKDITSRLARKEYDPTNNNTGYSFGVPQAPTSQPVFGGQAKYGMPLYGNGGQPIKYDSNFRPATSYEQKYNKETGLWEVSGAKPKSTSVKQTTKSNKVEPIYVTDPKDKRLQAYNDSSVLYNRNSLLKDGMKFGQTTADIMKDTYLLSENSKIKPISQKTIILKDSENNNMDWQISQFKKPVQPVILKKEVKVPVPKVNYLKNLPTEQDSKIDILGNNVQYQNEPTKESSTQEIPFKFKTKSPYGGPHEYDSKGRQLYKNGGEPTMKEYQDFNNFRKTVNPDYIGPDYDLQSAFRELPIKVLEDWKRDPEKNHLPDTYKLPNHPTFSIESKYYKKGMPAGYWNGDTYVPIDRPASTTVTNPNLIGMDDPNKQKNIMNRELERNNGVRPGFALGGFINKNKINNSLSNGMFSPDGKFFSSPEQYQQYQSFYNPQFQLQQPIMNNYGTLKMKSNFKNNSFFELGGDPRAQANIEAEQGEAMQHSSGKIEAIGGKKHPQGGTPIKVQPSHEYIYSDSLGYDKVGNITLNEKDVKKSFADKAKSIQKKYSKREGDSIVDKTKEIELGLLKQDAEQARVAKEEIEMGKQMKKYKAKYGADLKKFGNSGYTQYGVIPSGKQPSEEDNALTIQKRMLAIDPNALPKYGADGNWGTESQTAFDKLSPQMEGTPQFNFNPNSTPATLFGGGINPNPFIGPKPFNPSRRDNLHEAANFYTPGQVGISKSRAQKQGRQNDITPETTKKGSFFGDLTTGDKMQLASMLPAFGFNMGMGLRKADVEPNRKNPYENEVLSMMANRKFDPQHYLNQANLAANTAKEDIGNNSTSVGGKMANLQKLYANQLGTLGDITTKGQEMNNQYRAEEANTKNILGEANRAESIRAAGINDQNKARKQQFLAKAFEQLGQGIATTGQSANQSLTNKLLIKSLSEISPDFDVKNMKDLQVGDDGYIVFKGQKTEFKMSDEGKIVMASGTPNTANATKSQYAPKDFIMKTFANFTKAKTK